MTQVTLLYTTFASKEDALRISQNLLEKRLIACVNLLPQIHSLYLWEGKMENIRETAVILKTTSEKISELVKILQDLHPYETPAILEIPLHFTNEPFAKWIQEAVR